MNDRDFTRLDESIDKAIDDFNAERAPASPGPEDRELERLVDTVRILRRLRDPAWPDEAFADTLAGKPEHQLTITEPSVDRIARNGRGTLTGPTILLKRRRLATLRLVAAAMMRTIGVAMLAGTFAGIIAGGIGGRIVMRISAMLYLQDNPDAVAITESSGRQVGTFTWGGSVELLMEGAFMGLAGGIAYGLIRHLLPRSTWLRGVSFGLLVLVTFAAVAIDPDNEDLQRFGPAGLNLAMFASLFILFGAVIAPVAERIDNWLPRHGNRERSGKLRVPRMLARWGLILTVYGFGALGLFIMTLVSLSATLEAVTVVAEMLGIAHAGEDRPTAIGLVLPVAFLVLFLLALAMSAAHSRTGRQIISHSTSRGARPLTLLYRRDAVLAVQALLALGLIVTFGLTVREFVLALTATN